ncbi:Lrp/AsnC family transcriptional regulator [Streptomyces sp. NBC_01340]|uniref:Lrp/AsnC family transcriptional regulator n=1 Tax=unclassified Streptomyces TaxID=2593676 RepID=UPI00224D5DBC|nr:MULTISPECIES: Lrp/AsnC family transcriptional regulator [unclassified Streptomyces]MCX4458235.1 Lrp/AsnC family transcriptional regulator [Streptomyces sp. NBC_01719]MCX4497592.1 Lrp/AsnC family transcriptional regulator [Streptomyces sp. NBC_01728]WSI42418.1 Lrp/AsnC family transcriptional regulator [Streptomyces sp. NBC_01340]
MGVQDCAAAEAVVELDELDRAVVHALQIHPRAPWTLVGEVLGVNPVTAARRWHRLEEAGLAWVTAYPRLSNSRIVVSAVVEVDAEPGVAEDVAQALAADPAVANIKLTAGGRDLVAAVQARSLDELARTTTLLFQRTPGVRATRTHVSTGVPTEGSRWRLRSLDEAQSARIEAAVSPPGRSAPAAEARWDDLDARLLELLSVDGRMSLRDLSEATETSLTTVRRKLQSLLASRLSLRCDLARPLSGWPLSAVYFASVPGQYVEETSQVLSGVREVRSCAIIAGPHNLVIDVWLRDLRDVHGFEAHLSRKLPRLTVSDRSVVLRTVKHMGRLLDHDGRCIGVVPLGHPQEPRPPAGAPVMGSAL